MSAYRFCRTDDIPLLVEALNRCWRPWFPAEPEMTVARFKREIRDLQVWCSSCMVAFAGSDPIGVLIGAKRPSATLVHRIAVHPEHCRLGHGRHLLTSLSSKLSILGPPRIVAEIPEKAVAARSLFVACGFTRDLSHADYVLDPVPGCGSSDEPLAGRLVVPVTVDDLEANGLVGGADSRACWERSIETLVARRGEIAGLAVATDERIEAYLLFASPSDRVSPAAGMEILALSSEVADPGAHRLRLLLDHVLATAGGPLRISKAFPEELPPSLLAHPAFRRMDGHERYAAAAKAA